MCIRDRENEVMVKTLYSAISTGTETANLYGDLSIPGMRDKKPENPFPRYLGYSESGIVVEVGKKVTSLKAGDRVMCFWGKHRAVSYTHLSPVSSTRAMITRSSRGTPTMCW